MNHDLNLRLIRDKIYEMHSAIMYNLSNDVVRLPNNIVNVVQVDDLGQLWFICDKPMYPPDQYSVLFPVRLQFYRKGRPFHIEVSGSAELANNFRNEDEILANRWLIKMKMKNITYTETRERVSIDAMPWINKVYRFLSSHLSIPNHAKPLPGN